MWNVEEDVKMILDNWLKRMLGRYYKEPQVFKKLSKEIEEVL